MSVSINGTGGITFADASTQSTGGYTGFRNRIINGAMMVDQRNAGALIPAAGNQYTVDRWAFYNSQSGKLAVGQNAGAGSLPVGFTNYLGGVSLSSYTVTSTDYFIFNQPIEGLNVSDLAWGTANAKAVTLSFQVYSTLTGTFGGSIQNSAGNRSYPFSYTVSSAGTWTSVSVTIPGDTTGTWLTTNGIGMHVRFSLGSGSAKQGTANTWQAGLVDAPTGVVSVVGTNGATFYITGVQLEKGSVATPFEYRHYGTELQLCQRYYEIAEGSGGTRYSDAIIVVQIAFKVTKRAVPTMTYSKIYGSGGSPISNGSPTVNGASAYNTGAPTSSDATFQGFANSEL